MSPTDLLGALRILMDLEVPARARTAAALLPEHLAILDLLRASDGVQQLAQALDVQRSLAPAQVVLEEPYNPAASLYS